MGCNMGLIVQIFLAISLSKYLGHHLIAYILFKRENQLFFGSTKKCLTQPLQVTIKNEVAFKY